MKNVDAILSQVDRSFISSGRLFFTGTPLQNSLKELAAPLNFPLLLLIFLLEWLKIPELNIAARLAYHICTKCKEKAGLQ